MIARGGWVVLTRSGRFTHADTTKFVRTAWVNFAFGKNDPPSEIIQKLSRTSLFLR
jgi:hypothetical protein